MLTLSSISKHRNRFLFLLGGFACSMLLAWWLLAPKPGGAVSDYKFMHCKSCKLERRYETTFSEMKCLKCSPQKDGTYVPTLTSYGSGGGSPWKWFSVAAAIESIIFMGLLVFLLKERQEQPVQKMLYCNCPNCKWRLRFKVSSAGKTGQCPRCKRMFDFPEAATADTKEFPAHNSASSESWSET